MSNRSHFVIIALALSPGCGDKKPAGAPAPQETIPTAKPSEPPAPAPSPPAAAGDIHRLETDGLPGANPHRFGMRTFELRAKGSGLEVRMHDAIEFAGAGMAPKDKPPTQHSCTPWEALPATVKMPSGTTCEQEAATCDAIRAFYKGSAGSGHDDDVDHGRTMQPCS